MTDPTDAELGKLAEECGIGWGAGLGGMSDFLSAFARAVLAKWGTPQPAPAPLSDDTALLDGLARLNWYVGPGDFYCDEAGGMNDYDDKNSGPEELRQAIRAAITAQGTHHEQPICPSTQST